MSGFVRQYVTIAVVAAVVSLLGVALVAAGQVLRPAPRPRPDAAPEQASPDQREDRPRREGHRSSGLVVAVVICGAGLLLAPWAVGAGVLTGGELAVGLVAAAAVAAGLAAATR